MVDYNPRLKTPKTSSFPQWGVRHRLSTAEFPQSNGLAESAVKAIKAFLLKTDGNIGPDFQEGLLELRNTPSPVGKSLAAIVFGHLSDPDHHHTSLQHIVPLSPTSPNRIQRSHPRYQEQVMGQTRNNSLTRPKQRLTSQAAIRHLEKSPLSPTSQGNPARGHTSRCGGTRSPR
eukprot:maker-scaffold531_size145796-snap-gene-0.24 protein:Tk12611 transcript:maker-scaffold531_size145796-snap-gene-0.24-mRNA-1 annotation:"---NA---"